MTETIRRLLALQELDGRICTLRERASEVPGAVRRKRATVTGLREKRAAAEETMKTEKAEASRLELELKAGEEKIAKLEEQLNTARTNREYATFQEEIGGIKADASRIEDRVLEILGRVDELTKEFETSTKDMEAATADLNGLEAEARERSDALKAELGELEGRRGELAGELGAEVRSLYERILENKGATAVAAVKDAVCQGCFVNVTSQTVNLILQDNEIIRCITCRRILYLEDDEAARMRNA